VPTETVIVVTVVVCVFITFGIALVWADRYSRDVRVPGAKYFG
jgi:hypothetical protein